MAGTMSDGIPNAGTTECKDAAALVNKVLVKEKPNSRNQCQLWFTFITFPNKPGADVANHVMNSGHRLSGKPAESQSVTALLH